MELTKRVFVKPNPWIGGWDVLVLDEFENYLDDIERFGWELARKNYAILYIQTRRGDEKGILSNNRQSMPVGISDSVGNLESVSMDESSMEGLEQSGGRMSDMNLEVKPGSSVKIELASDSNHALMNEIIAIGYFILAILSPIKWITVLAIIFGIENIIESIYYSFRAGGYRIKKEKNEVS